MSYPAVTFAVLPYIYIFMAIYSIRLILPQPDKHFLVPKKYLFKEDNLLQMPISVRKVVPLAL